MQVTSTTFKGFEDNPPTCLHHSRECARQALLETQRNNGNAIPLIAYHAAQASVRWLATAYGNLETSVRELS